MNDSTMVLDVVKMMTGATRGAVYKGTKGRVIEQGQLQHYAKATVQTKTTIAT